MITIVEQLTGHPCCEVVLVRLCVCCVVLAWLGLAWIGLDCGEEVDWLLDNQDV